MSQEKEVYRFEKYTGQEQEVRLPKVVEGKPLCIIGSKAFLSCKTVEKLYLPETLEKVEDWGFAHMKNLRELTMPAGEIAFGKQVFLGCESLQKVNLYEVICNQRCTLISNNSMMAETERYEGIPYFLASMFRFFPEEQLEKPALAGDADGQWKWLATYDEELLIYMKRPHDYGFVPAFIGWFDVEDVDDQKARYMVEQRKHKIRLAFQRLRYDRGLKEEAAEYFKTFLRQESDLIEELFLEEKDIRENMLGRELSDYKIWQQSGGLDRRRVEELLQKLPEEAPEVRGYLVNLQLETSEDVDFFENLEL